MGTQRHKHPRTERSAGSTRQTRNSCLTKREKGPVKFSLLYTKSPSHPSTRGLKSVTRLLRMYSAPPPTQCASPPDQDCLPRRLRVPISAYRNTMPQLPRSDSASEQTSQTSECKTLQLRPNLREQIAFTDPPRAKHGLKKGADGRELRIIRHHQLVQLHLISLDCLRRCAD